MANLRRWRVRFRVRRGRALRMVNFEGSDAMLGSGMHLKLGAVQREDLAALVTQAALVLTSDARFDDPARTGQRLGRFRDGPRRGTGSAVRPNSPRS